MRKQTIGLHGIALILFAIALASYAVGFNGGGGAMLLGFVAELAAWITLFLGTGKPD